MSLANKVKIAGQELNVPVTMMDQVVNWISPEKGASRFQTRVRMAINGGYTAADTTRRANQSGLKRETDADSNILPDLNTLRAGSQNALRNSPIAVGAVKTNITKIVGTGLKVKPQIDREVLTHLSEEQASAWERKAKREFALATDTREIDSERQLPFSLLQALVLLKSLEDGDVFVSLPRIARVGSPYKLKLQLIEAARVCNPHNKPDTNRLAGGVEKDENGAPKNYHVTNRHPGNFRSYKAGSLTWKSLPAFGKNTGSPQVLHIFDKLRPGQTRGVPYLAPVIELIKQLGRYTDAEVMAAVVSGMLTVFVTNENGSPDIGTGLSETTTGDTTDDSAMELGYGSVLGLRPGESVESVTPGRPNVAFDPFVMAILRQVGVALELPFELLVKHFTASYSAARAALIEAQSYFNRRRHWLATTLCQPVYEAVITEAVATGRLNAPGFFSDPLIRKAWLSTRWTGDAFGQLDPVKEVKAAEGRIKARLSTREEECIAMSGTDWEDKLPQMAKERKLLLENDLVSDDNPETVDSTTESTSVTVDQTQQNDDKEDLENETD